MTALALICLAVGVLCCAVATIYNTRSINLLHRKINEQRRG